MKKDNHKFLRYIFFVLPICFLSLCACQSTQGALATEVEDVAASPKSDAQALALEIFRAYGGDKLHEVAEFRFRFVVKRGEKRLFEAFHRWDRKQGLDHITWTDQKGSGYDVIVDLRRKSAQAKKDGLSLEGNDLVDISDKAYKRWINDSYWFLMPLKLLDKGVTLSLEEPREWEGKTYQILKLSFENVGVTPEDQYWLFVDKESKRIVRWEMLLQGNQPPPEGVVWADFRSVGPVLVAHDHYVDDKSLRIFFEDTAALSEVDSKDFVIP